MLVGIQLERLKTCYVMFILFHRRSAPQTCLLSSIYGTAETPGAAVRRRFKMCEEGCLKAGINGSDTDLQRGRFESFQRSNVFFPAVFPGISGYMSTGYMG
ncbi:hypothetical protein TNCV_101261 [Trichonephila clavipes]|nr:hypothetical protein TNCV_101261 [Trichonephila clavipes]